MPYGTQSAGFGVTKFHTAPLAAGALDVTLLRSLDGIEGDGAYVGGSVFLDIAE